MPINFDQSQSDIIAGGDGSEGDITLQNATGQPRIQLRASDGSIRAGGNGNDGDILLYAANANDQTPSQATMAMSADGAAIRVGGNGTFGDIMVQNGSGQNRIHLQADGARLWLGGNGVDGDLMLFRANGDNQTLSQASILLNGAAGDIILQNGDCAEDFDAFEPELLEPGTVVSLLDEGTISIARHAYDRCVAGIVAGAGSYRPGIILGRNQTHPNRIPVALVGRVDCKADASQYPISVGDLLTTADNSGYAMKAEDPTRAFGAVIGKALKPLTSGTGLIPVLVALQ